jgi:hypothetical protein
MHLSSHNPEKNRGKRSGKYNLPITSTPTPTPTLRTNRDMSETKPPLLLLIPLKPAFVERLQQDWTVLEPEGGVKSSALATMDL